MKTETEVKFLNVNFDELRERLKAAGATLEQPMRLMRRVIIEPPELEAKDAFIRVRDEGDKVTLTYKQFHDHTAISGVEELEVTVSDFDGMVEILRLAGLTHKSFQESRRETWRLGDVEVVLDEWPWLDPYIEIEGPNEHEVKRIADLLGFEWEQAVFGSTTAAYQHQYPDGEARQLVNIPRIVFGEPVPDIISGKNKK
ncbi:MAG TPA: class IV adenylate cyclase [Candidatus Saccharimonadales bacterium]|nr:class IV adenylate cyclase [Candidatus Saccharimonadales bacterium]